MNEDILIDLEYSKKERVKAIIKKIIEQAKKEI